MTESLSHIGLLADGDSSKEQRAAAKRLTARDNMTVETVTFESV